MTAGQTSNVTSRPQSKLAHTEDVQKDAEIIFLFGSLKRIGNSLRSIIQILTIKMCTAVLLLDPQQQLTLCFEKIIAITLLFTHRPLLDQKIVM